MNGDLKWDDGRREELRELGRLLTRDDFTLPRASFYNFLLRRSNP